MPKFDGVQSGYEFGAPKRRFPWCTTGVPVPSRSSACSWWVAFQAHLAGISRTSSSHLFVVIESLGIIKDSWIIPLFQWNIWLKPPVTHELLKHEFLAEPVLNYAELCWTKITKASWKVVAPIKFHGVHGKKMPNPLSPWAPGSSICPRAGALGWTWPRSLRRSSNTNSFDHGIGACESGNIAKDQVIVRAMGFPVTPTSFSWTLEYTTQQAYNPAIMKYHEIILH